MNTPRTKRVWALAAVGLLLAAQLWSGLRPMADLDVWWHIKLGERIWETGTLVPTDPWSFTRAGTPWPFKDWGTALLLRSAWGIGGVPGIVIFKASVFVGTGALLFRWLQHHRKLPLPLVIAITALALDLASFRFTERGASVSLLILVAVLVLVERHRNGQTGLWWVLPLTILNANIHRGVLLLPVLLGALAVVSVFERYVQKRSVKVGQPAAVAVGAVLACLVTPFGIQIITTTIALMQNVTPMITEWAPVELPLVYRLAPALLLFGPLAVVGGLARGIKDRDPWDVVLVLLAVGFGLQSMRHLPYLALIGAGPTASGLAALSPRTWTGSLRHLIAISAGTLALVAQLVRPLPGPALTVAPAHYPEKGVAFLNEHQPTGNGFNDFAFGGYLIFHRQPAQKVYIDGRTDLVYTPQMVETYVKAVHNPEVFAAEVERWDLQWVIIDNAPPQGTLAHLDRNRGWRLIHASRRALIYVRRDGPNAALAEELGYRWVWPHALARSVLEADRRGHGKEAVRELQRMVESDPDNIYARDALSRILGAM